MLMGCSTKPSSYWATIYLWKPPQLLISNTMYPFYFWDHEINHPASLGIPPWVSPIWYWGLGPWTGWWPSHLPDASVDISDPKKRGFADPYGMMPCFVAQIQFFLLIQFAFLLAWPGLRFCWRKDLKTHCFWQNGDPGCCDKWFRWVFVFDQRK